MSVPHSLDAPVVAHGDGAPVWPTRLGVAGLVVGALMTFTALQNLALQLTWTNEDWRELLAPYDSGSLAEVLPSSASIVLCALIETVLGLFLLNVAWKIFWRDRRGIATGRWWARMTLAYLAVVTAWIFVWMAQNLGEAVLPAGSRGAAYFGFFVSMGLLAAFPLFLLYWLRRPDVRHDVESW
ncbi:MAG: hypothetical protein PVJ49_05640 [Acidobacteriota bacterium]|jgi:hypothetical protein